MPSPAAPNQQVVPRRTAIIGKSGVGKTTLARRLSKITAAKYVELDAIYWKPGWQERLRDDMREVLDRSLPADGSWIADGSYTAFADITWGRADLVIWLDYPLLPTLWQLVRRTVWRIRTGARICGDNRESWRAALSLGDDNIILWCVKQHWRQREKFPGMIEQYGKHRMLVFKEQQACEDWVTTIAEARRNVVSSQQMR